MARKVEFETAQGSVPTISVRYYLDKRGRMDLLRFFEDHRNMFPTLWIISQCKISNQVVEVECERFFDISGYVSSKTANKIESKNI